MILGKGQAQTEAEIIEEYQRFLAGQGYSAKILEILQGAPGVMRHRLDKPLAAWEEDDILVLFADRGKQAGR